MLTSLSSTVRRAAALGVRGIQGARAVRIGVGFAAMMLISVSLGLGGCSSYATPGRGADMSVFNAAQAKTSDGAIREAFAAEPFATFPASIAVCRVQAPGYRNHAQNDGYGSGAYTVVTQREVESDEVFGRISALSGVQGLAPMNRLLLSTSLQSDRELRAAAGSLRADLLLIYTFDTTFDSDQYAGIVSVVSLGLFPTEVQNVRSTASAILLDTRTGFVHALAEGRGDAGQLSNAWTSEEAAEDARLRAERRAFEKLVDGLVAEWPKVLAANKSRTTTPTGPTPTSAAAGMITPEPTAK